MKKNRTVTTLTMEASASVVGEIRNPTTLAYVDFGQPTIVWNFDALPAGRWKDQVSTDLVTWTDTGAETERAGVAGYSTQYLPSEGFCRVLRIG